MLKPICPSCGARDAILVVQKEIRYYQLTHIGEEFDREISDENMLEHCGQVDYVCGSCNAVLDHEEILEASQNIDTSHIGA